MDGTWKISDIGTALKNCFAAILKGEFLLRLNIDRYFAHVVYTFVIFAAIIWFSLVMDSTLAQVEKNKKILEELEIVHNQKTFEVVSLSRRSSVSKALSGMGSKVNEATKPATVIVK